jgi:hypothetical protein
MRPRGPTLLLVSLAILLFAAIPMGLAHEEDRSGVTEPPHDAALATNGPVGFWTWTSEPGNTSSTDVLEPGASGVLQVAWEDMPDGGNATYNATVAASAPDGMTLTGSGTFETGNITGDDTRGPFHLGSGIDFAVNEGFEGTRTFTVNATVFEANTTQRNGTGNETVNVTTWERVDAASLSYDLDVKKPAPPPDGLPWLVIGGLVAAGGALAAGGAYVYRRRQGPRAPRRSQALQELEAEDDEEVQQQVEQERAEERKSRELRILEAKAEDHQEGIERARKRLEEGELTEHQFERIKERKEEALQDVLDEIEEKKQDPD